MELKANVVVFLVLVLLDYCQITKSQSKHQQTHNTSRVCMKKWNTGILHDRAFLVGYCPKVDTGHFSSEVAKNSYSIRIQNHKYIKGSKTDSTAPL